MLSLVALAAVALVAAQPFRGVFLSDAGATLSIFELDNADHLATRRISGATTRLDAVDFRATDGALIGYQRIDAGNGAFFTVNPCTGVTTPLLTTTFGGVAGDPVVGTAVTVAATQPPAGSVDIDVNPTRATAGAAASASCAVRVIGGGVSIGANVCTGKSVVGVPATIDSVDGGPVPVTGAAANTAAAAYSNNVNNNGARVVALSTVLYTVDATTDSLYVFNFAAGSSLATLVGPLGIDVVAGAGLDIFTDVSRVPSNRLILKNGKNIYELNPANAAIIDRAQVHDNNVVGESGLSIGRFTCSGPSSSKSSDSSSSSSSSSK